jgi:hypothetical protein
LAAKVAGNKSVNGCMRACNDKSGRQKTTQNQPTTGAVKAGIGGGSNGDSNGSSGGGGGG